MIIYNTDNNKRIIMTYHEYLKTCEEYNEHHKHLPQTSLYDLDEIVYYDFDKIIITTDMLDEGDKGFYMFSDHFYDLIRRYTNYPLIHDEKPIGVNI